MVFGGTSSVIFVSDPEFGRAAQVMLKDAAALERAASSLNETDVGTLRCVTVLIRPSLTCFQVCVCNNQETSQSVRIGIGALLFACSFCTRQGDGGELRWEAGSDVDRSEELVSIPT